MSKLDDLIKNLCPDGVEFKKLENCCVILDNKRKPITKSARIAGKYPYYGANGIQDYVSDYIFDGTFVLVGEDGSVMTSNGNPVVNWAEGKIWVNNHAHIISEKNGILLRYLFHFVQTVNIAKLIHGNIPKLTNKDFREIKIPVPPLEVQREIVRILDNFTELTEKLTAELTARKKQYEYYRDLLLNFGGGRQIEWKTLGEIFNIRNGYTPSKNNPNFWEGGTISWFRMDDIRKNGRFLKDSLQKITPSGVKGKLFEKNSIILATTATIGEHALLLSESLANQRFTNFSICEGFKNKLLPKFIFYYFFVIDEWSKKNIKVGNFPSVDMDRLKNFQIPIPPIEEQERIVKILDRFDKLCNDLTEGLPAEISARKKQYEYYRDKLLTFKEK